MARIPLSVAQRSLDVGQANRYPTDSPIGDAAQRAGDMLSNVSSLIQQRRERKEAFDTNVVESELDAVLDSLPQQLLQDAPADGSGLHDAAVGQYDPATGRAKPGRFDDIVKEYRSRVPQSQLARFDARLEERRLRLGNRMAAVQYGQEQKYYSLETKKVESQLLNSILQADPNDTTTFERFKAQGRETLQSSGLGKLEKQAALEAWEGSAAEALFQARRAKDPTYAGQKALADLGLAASGSVVDRIIGVESGGNATAKNPRSSATGLGQFTAGTWMATVRRHEPGLMDGLSRDEILDLRNNPTISRRMTGYLAADNSAALRAAGLPVNDGSVYLAHFAGSGGAVSLLKADPSTPVASILGQDAVAANPFLAGKSAGEVVAWAQKKMGGAPSGPDPLLAAIPPDRRLILARQAEADAGKQTAEFQDGFKDYLSYLRDGNSDNGSYSPDALFGVLPPQQAAEAQQQINAARAYGKDVSALAFASPEEVAAIVERRAADMQTPSDYRREEQDMTGLQTVLKARNEAIAKDPAAYVLRQPDIAQAYQRLGDDQSPEASANYVRSVLAEQTRLGVPAYLQRVLPERYAAQLASGFNEQTQGGQNAATLMRSLEKQWGSNWNRVFGEMAATKQVSGTALVVGAMNRPTQAKAAEALAAASKIGTTELKKAIPTSALTTIDQGIDTAMDGFMGTLANNGASGLSTFNTFREAIYQLSLVYARSDSPNEAVRRAYDDVIAKAYTIQDTYRVPVEIDADQIADNAESILSRVTGDGLRLPASGLDEASTRAAYLDQIKTNGFWVTNGDETGLTLFDETGAAVTTKDGQPVSFTWSQILASRDIPSAPTNDNAAPPLAPPPPSPEEDQQNLRGLLYGPMGGR